MCKHTHTHHLQVLQQIVFPVFQINWIIVSWNISQIFVTKGNKNIYISRVAEGSAGEKCNLRAGDQLLSANYISLLNQVSLKRAYDLLINSGNRFVWLTILPRAEAMQYMENRNECYTWIDCHGQSVSPPSPLSPEEEDTEIKTPETTRATPSGRLPRFKDLFSLSQLSHTPFVSKLSNFSLFRREKPQSLCHVRQVRPSGLANWSL